MEGRSGPGGGRPMKLPPFSYLRPETLPAVLETWSASGADTMFLAGGQGLISEMGQGLRRPRTLIDVSAIRELRTVEPRPEESIITIGAAVRLSELSAHPHLRSTLLAVAARHVAVAPVRTLATVGGNFCHGHPTSELPLAALVAGATLTGLQRDGTTVRLAGNELSALRPASDNSDVLITSLEWPMHDNGHISGFTEVGEQRSWIPAAALCWQTTQRPGSAWGMSHARIGVALRDGLRFLINSPDGAARCSAETVEQAAAAAGVSARLPSAWIADLANDALSPGSQQETT